MSGWLVTRVFRYYSFQSFFSASASICMCWGEASPPRFGGEGEGKFWGDSGKSKSLVQWGWGWTWAGRLLRGMPTFHLERSLSQYGICILTPPPPPLPACTGTLTFPPTQDTLPAASDTISQYMYACSYYASESMFQVSMHGCSGSPGVCSAICSRPSPNAAS